MTNTGNNTACLDFVLVEPDPRVSATQGQIRSSPLSLHLRDTQSKQQKHRKTLYGTSLQRSNWERLGCLFTICIQSSFDTVPCLSFSETTKRQSPEIPFLASSATQTHEMVPSYQISLTITDSLGVRAVV